MQIYKEYWLYDIKTTENCVSLIGWASHLMDDRDISYLD